MITDLGLRLATAETPCNGGAYPSGLGGDSVALGLDLAGLNSAFVNNADPGGGVNLALAFNVDTSFESDTVLATVEYQLVSIPILATLLDNGSGGAGNGKLLKASLSTVVATETITLTAHGFPVAAPVYISDLGATTTGPTPNIVYYVVPTGANSFELATTIALAIAETPDVLLAGTNAVADFEVNVIPTVHASTGSLPVYQNATVDVTPLIAGTRFIVPLRPLVGLTTEQQLPTGQTKTQPVGAGPAVDSIAAMAQRYFYLRTVVSTTGGDPTSAVIDAGAVTCDLVLDGGAGDPLSYTATSVKVL